MAARGSKIIITTDPKGVFLEGIIATAEKPGTICQITSAFSNGGRHTYGVYNPGTDGERRAIIVLLEDDNQGKVVTDAYTAGKRARFYVPQAGEELNILFHNQTGTADDVAVLDPMIVDTGTGKIHTTTGSPESEPFIALEAQVDPTADVLLPCMYTGY